MDYELLPNAVDRIAQNDPFKVYTRFALTTGSRNVYRDITYRDFANAVNLIAACIEECFGKAEDFETIAYLGPNDPRYPFVLLAGIKTGYKIFFPSPRNSKEAQLELLSRTECLRLITTTPALPPAQLIADSCPMNVLAIPSLEEILAKTDVAPYPFTKVFAEARDDPICVLHTSGSTGTPKPMIYTHKFFARADQSRDVDPPKGLKSVETYSKTGSFLCFLPAFHMGGLGFLLMIPIRYGSIPVWPVAGAPPTCRSLLDAAESTQIDWAFLPPTIIGEMGKDPDLLDRVSKRLKYVFFAGGALPKQLGDIVARRMPVYQILGSSEAAGFPLIRSPKLAPEDWPYIQINPSVNVEFQYRFGDLYEMVQVRLEDSDSLGPRERFQPVFCHFPELKAFETRDLFAPHPSIANAWKYVSRIDDIIVFLNGEKTNPVSFEEEVCRHNEVKAAIVVGSQRDEASLILELVSENMLSKTAERSTIDRIWPMIQDANSRCPRHARISKAKIIIADPAKPFPRAGKGTVQRQAALALYEKEINRLYTEALEPEDEGQQEDQALSSEGTKVAMHVLRDAVEECASDLVLQDDDDFFAHGLDSLQAIQLRRELQQEFPTMSLPITLIYENPTIRSLTGAMQHLMGPMKMARKSEEKVDLCANLIQMYETEIDALAAELNAHRHNNSSHQQNGWRSKIKEKLLSRQTTARDQAAESVCSLPTKEAVLLTGSTGALGSHILNELIDQGVEAIYCLNRAEDSRTLQQSRNRGRRLPTTFPPSVEFLTGETHLPFFGLNAAKYHALQASVGSIIHNAWPVDFNKNLQSFRPSLDGVAGLIAFAARSGHPVDIQFLSSIAAVSSYAATDQDNIPEVVMQSFSVAGVMGYGQSKYIAERMLDYASKKLQNIWASSLRIGQIAGDATRGIGWNRQEWFPSMVISSYHLGAIPRTLGAVTSDVDWIPIDKAASIIVELRNAKPKKSSVFHIVNPKLTPWQDVFDSMRASLNRIALEAGGRPMKVVPYASWVDLLEQEAIDVIGADQVPAIKLLPFFQALMNAREFSPKLDLKEALQSSEVLRKMVPLQAWWLDAWIRNWIEPASE